MRKPHPHDPGVTHGRRARNVVVATGIVGATVAAGSVASDPTSDWYVSLDKPAWQPPGYVFPIAWTTLYTSIAVASAAVLNELEARGDTVGARKFGVALVRNQALNAFWSWVFFRWHNLPAATLAAAALALSSIDLARRAGRVDPKLGALLAPYAGWTTFATVLAGAVWQRNPDPQV